MSRIRSIHPGLWTDEARSSGRFAHVYVVQEGDGGPCKIGIARNAFWRLSDLQVGNWRTIHLRALFTADDRGDAVQIEAAVLRRFLNDRIGGEWLSTDTALVALFIQEEFVDGAD